MCGRALRNVRCWGRYRTETMPYVLVVEDESRVLKNVELSLSRAGFQVMTATTCEAAWEVFDSNKIDAICLDIILPDGNGLCFLERVRRIAPDLPTIVISSVLNPEMQLRALELGVQEFLPKPFSLASLKEALARCLVSA